MPVIKSAIKKLRHDKKREKENQVFLSLMEKTLRIAKKSQGKKEISSAFSLLDKAVKKHLVHKNKAARLKSALVKVKSETAPTTTPKAKPAKSKKAVKKTAAKAKTTSRKSK